MWFAVVLMVQFNIPQQGTLGDQMNAFYWQTTITLLALSPALEVPARHALVGRFEVWDGLCRLVQGTGLYVASHYPERGILTTVAPPASLDPCHPCPTLDSWGTPECVRPPQADWGP
jgi:hypothetical protein